MNKLTPSELKVLEYLVQGYNNKEIGKILFISQHTAKSHVCSIIKKTNLRDRTEVAYWAGKYNIL
ncbi:response regulator transcription factor [bacterium]|nr:response regulator transcription factor [bacterium]